MIEALTWPTVLLLFGLCLLVAEFFLPTGGMLGLLAAISLVASLYLSSLLSSAIGYRWFALELVMIAATWSGAVYGLPRTKIGRRVYLQPPTGDDLEARAPVDPVGSSGRALTPLRPSGMIDVGGRRVEAMAEFGLIGAGAAVTVVAVRSGRVVVRVDQEWGIARPVD